jgi:hypothetical protein
MRASQTSQVREIIFSGGSFLGGVRLRGLLSVSGIKYWENGRTLKVPAHKSIDRERFSHRFNADRIRKIACRGRSARIRRAPG